MRFLKSFLHKRALSSKFIFLYSLLIVIPMAALGAISYILIDARLQRDAEEKVSIGLKSALTEYGIRADQMKLGMLQASAMEEIKTSVRERDVNYLKKTMMRWKQNRPYVDLWTVVDKNSRVIARLNSAHSGDRLDFDNTVLKAFATKEPQLSTEIITQELLRREGEGFEKKFAVPVSQDIADGYKEAGADTDYNALTVIVVVPVLGEDDSIEGAIITGNIINRDPFIPAAVAEKVPGLLTNISMNGRIVSTNIILSDGSTVLGLSLPDYIISEINTGKTFHGERTILGNTYISAFAPLMNNKGNIIGSLSVNLPKSILWSLQRENLFTIAGVTVFGLILSIIMAVVSAYKVTKPLRVIGEKVAAFANGDENAKIDMAADTDKTTKDELQLLAWAFNLMVDEVRSRTWAERLYLKELEEKNKQQQELNEKLSASYEELEVAYEESHSQTEEIHSMNEELKLLNEDLDRKNSELTEANRRIHREEESLRKAKDELRLIYDSIKNYFLLIDHDCTIVDANTHFMKQFGANGMPVIGRKLYTFFGFSRQEHLERCPVIKCLKTLEPAEEEFQTKDGRLLRWSSFPLIEGDKRPDKAAVYIEDMTEERLLMQRLVQADKMSSLGELVSGVAHELNNPLMVIMGYSELLLRKNINELAKKKLTEINSASHRCKTIINNLLTFGRKHEPEKEYTDVNELVRKAFELKAYQLKTDNIDIQLNLSPSLPKTMLDGLQIQQVLLNLINNAQHAVQAEGKGERITISTRQVGDNLQIEVSDTGTGIPDNIIEHIFNPFFTTKETGKGTGLGLSISFSIIKAHGGSIYARNNRPDKGATFIIEIPVIKGEEKVSTSPAQPDAQRPAIGKGLRALILDDEPFILDVMRETLSTVNGFTVDTTTRGEDALSLLKKHQYDIIFSDLKIPGMGGETFYRNAKSLSPENARKIIFISGDTASEKTQTFLKESNSLFLHKPFTIEHLNEVIRRFMERGK